MTLYQPVEKGRGARFQRALSRGKWARWKRTPRFPTCCYGLARIVLPNLTRENIREDRGSCRVERRECRFNAVAPQERRHPGVEYGADHMTIVMVSAG